MAIRVIWPNRPTHVETGMRKRKSTDIGQIIVERTITKAVLVDLVDTNTRLLMDPMTARCLANTILSVLAEDGKLPNGTEPLAR